MRLPWVIVLGLTKIDWLELQRGIESGCARSARRRALLSQSHRQGGKRVLLGLLQLRHSRRRIWDAGHRPCRVHDDCFLGSSATMTLPSLVVISNVPCGESL